MGGVQLDAVEAGLQGVLRRDAVGLHQRGELRVAERARCGRLAPRAHRRRCDGRVVALGAERLAAEVHELHQGDRARFVDGVRATPQARLDLGPPGFGEVPAPDGRIGRHHGASRDDHGRTAGRHATPVLGVAGDGETVGDRPAAVRRGHDPVAQPDIGLEVQRVGQARSRRHAIAGAATAGAAAVAASEARSASAQRSAIMIVGHVRRHGGDRRHDRGVDDVQALEPMHLAALIDHRPVRARLPHRAGSDARARRSWACRGSPPRWRRRWWRRDRATARRRRTVACAGWIERSRG